MKNFQTHKLTALFLTIIVQLIFMPLPKAFAATDPSLGQAASFAILSGSYINTVSGTTINGDLGYTTGPATAPTVNGGTHVADSKYNQGGIDQGSALSALASQPCTTTFPAGAVDLATDTTGHSIGVYPPGVYCTTAASSASIGGGGTITLTGGGTYIFRINGALTTSNNSIVTFSGGASACDVFWTPTSATTLGANSTFAGTDIDASGITIGSTVNWVGRALAFGGTVSTATDTITSTGCTPATSSGSTTSNSSSSTTGTAAPCIASPITTIPIIIDFRRVNATSVFISWGPFAGINSFNVRYGLTNGNWLYNAKVTGFSTTLNDLPPGQPIWVQVAATNSCAIGTYGEAKLIGAPTLPHSGFAPNQNTTPWYVFAGVLVGFTLLFYRIRRFNFR